MCNQWGCPSHGKFWGKINLCNNFGGGVHRIAGKSNLLTSTGWKVFIFRNFSASLLIRFLRKQATSFPPVISHLMNFRGDLVLVRELLFPILNRLRKHYVILLAAIVVWCSSGPWISPLRRHARIGSKVGGFGVWEVAIGRKETVGRLTRKFQMENVTDRCVCRHARCSNILLRTSPTRRSPILPGAHA